VSLEVTVTTEYLIVVETPYAIVVTETDDGLTVVETGITE
jgi:hypothetical protein